MYMKIAMGQMPVFYGRIEDNMNKAVEMIAQAAKEGCQIIVLPECMDIGWANGRDLHLAEPLPGRIIDRLCHEASNNHIWIVAGLTEKDRDKYYNTSVLISDQGQIKGSHRKINLVPGVETMYTPGTKVEVFETPWGKTGLTICADNLSETLCFGESLAKMGAKWIFSPSAWAVSDERYGKPYGEEWLCPYTELSKKYGVNVIGVSNTGMIEDGPWKGFLCIGNSIAVTEHGAVRKILSYGENAQELGIVYVPV